MATRTTILSEVTTKMQELVTDGTFAEIKNFQTEYLDENAFPMMYVLLGNEIRQRHDTNMGFRGDLDIIIRIVAKGGERDATDIINPLIEAVINKAEEDFSFNKSVLDAVVVQISTDEGIAAPFALAELIIEAFYLE